ncbi:type II toxin-antitoxin system RelE/ParE family toxin [Flavobacterium sp. 3-218]
MGLKIFWTDFAKKELRNIFDYYKREASLNVARNLVSGITKETVKLISHSEIGQEEELLINNPNGIRYLIYKNYKIIY